MKVAVLRALQLGDLLCVVPALRALRHALPQAQVTLIGLPWAKKFARRFHHHVDDFLALPGYPGLPEQPLAAAALPAFIALAQQRKFDLVLQMHGSGVLTNPLAMLLGGRRTAGFHEAGQYCPDPENFLVWNEDEHEVLRLLRLLSSLGMEANDTRLEFPLWESDFQALAGCSGKLPARGAYACIHPGARLPSRRWPPERFAAIADRLSDHGLRIVLTGAVEEAAITDAVGRQMRAPALDLSGKTTLGALAALIGDARMMVSNDTGISHIAAAVKTPSVVICSGANPRRWAPLDRDRHRVLAAPMVCRPCMHDRCPLAGHPCAANVSVEQVWAEVSNLMKHVKETGDERSALQTYLGHRRRRISGIAPL
ncbi:MAG: glycosyltransferase family 9 protein [Pseudomonadota bacterium]